MLTYENEKEPFYGKDAIIKKLCDQRLAFQRVAHVRNTITAQPANGGALILVTGTVMVCQSYCDFISYFTYLLKKKSLTSYIVR